jgi:phosphoribosylformylglycinamidine (FGAM) synthase-like enzyme
MHGWLFSESAGRVVVTCAQKDLAKIRKRAGDLPLTVLGTVGGDALAIERGFSIDLADLERAYNDALLRAIS